MFLFYLLFCFALNTTTVFICLCFFALNTTTQWALPAVVGGPAKWLWGCLVALECGLALVEEVADGPLLQT